MFNLILKGGPVMWLLFLCSFWGLYTVINQFLYFRNNSENIEKVSDYIKNSLQKVGKLETIEELRSNFRHTHNVIYHSLIQAIQLSDNTYDEIQSTLQSYLERKLRRLSYNQQVLSSIIAIAPILGLLGTVLGLIDVFNVISGGGIGDASALSSGIAEALITTVTGLTIAAPFILIHRHYDNKINAFIGDHQYILNDILRFCKSKRSGVKP